MKEEKNNYERVIKKFLALLALLFTAPFLFSISFKAKKLYPEGIGNYVAEGLQIIAILLLVYAVYFGFKTFKLLLDTLFKND